MLSLKPDQTKASRVRPKNKSEQKTQPHTNQNGVIDALLLINSCSVFYFLHVLGRLSQGRVLRLLQRLLLIGSVETIG